jgi:hypothetical protein
MARVLCFWVDPSTQAGQSPFGALMVCSPEVEVKTVVGLFMVCFPLIDYVNRKVTFDM